MNIIHNSLDEIVIFTNFMHFSTEIGLAAQTYMKAGQLVPDDVMVKLISSELAGLKASPWLLDGFPRTRPQAEALHNNQKVSCEVMRNGKVPHVMVAVNKVNGKILMFQSPA